jgi:hypothetical protein
MKFALLQKGLPKKALGRGSYGKIAQTFNNADVMRFIGSHASYGI